MAGAEMSSSSSTSRCTPSSHAVSPVELHTTYPQSEPATIASIEETIVEPNVIWSDLSPALQDLIHHIDFERTELTPPSTPSWSSNGIRRTNTHKSAPVFGFNPEVVLFMVRTQKSRAKDYKPTMKHLPGLGYVKPEVEWQEMQEWSAVMDVKEDLYQLYFRGLKNRQAFEKASYEWSATQA
jgi:hypothetical protein